ncbi:MAG TPA: nuclear transport factor 2 family protein [Candidatus Obscuribacterales bacterium]
MSSIRTNSLQSAVVLLTGLQLLCLPVIAPAAHAVEIPAAPTSADMSLPAVTSEQDRTEVEKLLANIETDWNAHNLTAVMAYYSDDYLNNDGLDKNAVSKLTEDFWKTYPDAKSKSTTKEIRFEGSFATVESRDVATGTTAKEMPGIGTKGELTSVSEGQLYLKKQGQGWKIVGDRIDYERVRVAFGLARQVQATFSAPEQVKSNKPYTAKLELGMPSGLTAVGSITNTPLQYPQPQPEDAWRPMNEPTPERPLLERVLVTNNKNRNELLMATIGITNSQRNSLMGIAFLTRRINVIPNMEEEQVKIVEKTEGKDKGMSGFNVPEGEIPKPGTAK